MNIERSLIGVVLAGLCCALSGVAADDLAGRFIDPPEGTKPRCYWYWLDGHVTKDGITRDLEAMKRVGIGEGYIGIIGGQSGRAADSAVKALSDEWWSFIEHAMREGTRLGVDVGLFNSPGWSQSGGPWVKPEQAMRYITMPELRLKGPQSFEGKLPVPAGEFQDVAVLAFPVPGGEDSFANIIERLPASIKFGMAEPFTARSITVQPVKQVNVEAELMASDDGQQYRLVKKFRIDRHNLVVNVGPVPLAAVVASFPATAARFFQLKFSADCELGEIRLSSAARVESFAEKAMLKMFQDPLPPFGFYSWPAPAEPELIDLVINQESVRDISKMMTTNGVLKWDVPAGDWIVLRTAMTPTGTKNSPAPAEATGLEVDKMSRPALKSHFDAYVGNLLRRMPEAERKSFKHVVADSYEMGPENWTDDFAADFRNRYGYDPICFLPVMTGRIVGSADKSDRFLWDLRRMVADRVAADYVGGLRDLCRENGLKMWLENYGHWGFPGEFLLYGGNCDEISGEFWESGDLGSIELRDAASAAHIYGMPVVWAEAFTGGPAFQSAPGSLKARGDWAFCEGINQFVLHVYIHQPWSDKRPGVNAWFGTEFNRNNTWFEYSKAWIDYQRRCSVMLQAGRHVADVAYFIGEDAPKMTGLCDPKLPAGYDFDYINADVIVNRLSVKGGRFVLPDGMSYSLLVLPKSETMRPELLKKISELVAQGGKVHGSAPVRSPSGKGFPACDDAVKKLAAGLWDEKKIIQGDDLKGVLEGIGVLPDIICPDGILWKHRHDDGADIYFLSNQRSVGRSEKVVFRVSGMPELWDAVTGEIRRLPEYRKTEDGKIEIPLRFESEQAYFVVVRKVGPDRRAVRALTESGGSGSPALPKNFPELKSVHAITGPWAVAFDSKWFYDQKSGVRGQESEAEKEKVIFDKLEDWAKRPEEGIKYYSGTAVYRKIFDFPVISNSKSQISEKTNIATCLQSEIGDLKLPQAPCLWLSLGEVRDMARVRLNGKDLGVVWCAPWRVDITDAVKIGENELEIDVVNTWANRLLGDAGCAAGQRPTYVTAETLKGVSLKPAGLLGPVTISGEDN